MEAFIESTLAQYRITPKSIVKICSIDLKADEQAIIRLADKYKVDFVTFTAQQLRAVQGEFIASPFVKNVVGVDNVCERSAVLGSCYGSRFISKTKFNGMTLAACEIEHKLKF
jgi:cobalt-precorrin 5A hydrolase